MRNPSISFIILLLLLIHSFTISNKEKGRKKSEKGREEIGKGRRRGRDEKKEESETRKEDGWAKGRHVEKRKKKFIKKGMKKLRDGIGWRGEKRGGENRWPSPNPCPFAITPRPSTALLQRLNCPLKPFGEA
jgi:hypothetical protein